jgi:Sec-independent protein secretion pathway component TatC
VDCERKISLLPRLWRIFTLIVLIIAGFLTPTIDGYTQLGFSAAAIFLYVIIIQLIQKRLHKKFIGVNFLGY